MAKWSGKIGFAVPGESRPGIWEDVIEERPYRGDQLQNYFRNQATDQLNDDINIVNKISIVADPYAMSNFHTMRYVTLGGAKWKITNIEVSRPRLILTIGGLYNG